ncbi:nicotinate-nucleotide--dimethylbenzimidazole phosphoribosyltransferase [Azospirillum rugosum]|uniref:Nicotinate-nucleotide--dimethylbenzimidazole phosphoribosyltransferase n=1 Tax=Azospirillum rugosum TaxID=416170 RepID=A0ABS4SIC3_9PROT|nr:nicotinate-nucleotide--dimethylbenzimidazole phosphoribosyltransferase [Azospirillum rugosum]MBP2292311.1 nicotinate-nucleotide--dimethylbenzimidazole phosphoribosyltransferase [Azospirillum rugosum]MDQ0526070.1 nicotinate-nucleotide--dimethylbenzimidazole phosphoribosyltransferase [Azospirillum rugosum]
MSNLQPAITFEEIRALVRNLPGPDLDSGTAALQRERQLTKPAGSLGRLEEIAQWMATWQGQHPAEVRRPRVAVFAGNHGVAARGVSAYPADVTAQMVANFQNGGAAVNQLCEVADADLRVYELDLENPTADFTQGPAMGEEECCRAMAYGMMAVEQGVQLLALGEMGIGNSTAAAAICCALFGGEAKDWVGRGTGVDDEGLARKAAAIEAGLAANPQARGDAFEALRCFGGYELAAIAGAILAARMARVPVLLDGYACTAVAAVLFKADRRALDHCMVAHRSVEPGHSRLLEAIGKEPLLDLGMRLGEGSGATLAINIVRSACACHAGMATFAEAGVSTREG